MTPRIALPLPTSADVDYNERNGNNYATAIRESGGEPVGVALDLSPRAIAELANTCQGVCLPGSPADVNPGKYGQSRDPATAPTDLPRENVDELLIQDAHNLYKPIFAICFGMQILNVWRSGTLVQDLTIMPVNHAASASVGVAHSIVVEPGSLLADILCGGVQGGPDARPGINSSHHQAVGIAGDGLRVSARCPQDGVAEAIEGGQFNSTHRDPENHGPAGDSSAARPAHFVLGVQWHPERTFATDAFSRALFARFVEECSRWTPRPVLTSVAR